MNRLFELLAIRGRKGGGGTGVAEKEVNFYDYDGTCLYAYTVEEAQALNELPALPAQTGLICQGWNYDLDTIKAYNRAVDVGASYITDDGKTRLYISVPVANGIPVQVYTYHGAATNVSIDWGDNTTPTLNTGNGFKKSKHVYSGAGDYVITIEVEEGGSITLGGSSSGDTVMGEQKAESAMSRNALRKVEIGKGIERIANYAFQYCYQLKNITIPEGVTYIGDSAFLRCRALDGCILPKGITFSQNAGALFNECRSMTCCSVPDGISRFGSSFIKSCESLKRITIPNTVTYLGYYVFQYNTSLEGIFLPNGPETISDGMFEQCETLPKVRIPEGITNIKGNAFYGCGSLTSVEMPSTITSIAAQAFSNCYHMASIDFSKCTSVPSLGSTNAFGFVPETCKYYVPAALYDEWIAATNWAMYASQIVAV